MLYTTYGQLVGQSSMPGLIEYLQTLTGSRTTYGDSTPIYLVNVLDSLGISITATCLYGVLEDTSYIQKLVALEMVKAHLLPWNTAFPGDSRLADLLYYAEKVLEDEVPEEVRLNHCGEPMNYQGLSPEDLVTSLCADLSAYVDTLDISPKTYTFWTWTTGLGPNGDEEYKDYVERMAPGDVLWETETNDNLVNPIPGASALTWYLPVDIDLALAQNPDYFLAQSDRISTSGGQKYYRVRCKKDLTSNEPNYDNQAAIYTAWAVTEAAQMIAGEPASLVTVISYIKSAYRFYDAARKLDLGPQMARYRDLTRGGFPLPVNPGSGWEVDEQALFDAGKRRRADLLRDSDYIKSFDVSLNNQLSITELLALETGVREQMQATMAAAGQALYDALAAESSVETDPGDSLSAIFRPYLL